jgi:ABC-type glycerol-3-phosphate transport system substrate-binding protein
MNYCPQCGFTNKDTARFCQQCATPLVAEISCPSCGTKNPAQARFCLHCATPLRGQTPQGGITGLLAANTMLTGRYTILRRLGKGGMAAVYLATDGRLAGKQWAVKEMSDAALLDPAEKKQAIAAFKEEARLLAELNHPNLTRVVDFFEESNKHYLVMDFVSGQTLENLLAGRTTPFPETQVLAWADQLCDVLAYLHGRTPPIIFRDLKPGNIMVEPDGRLRLIDFGIARLFKPGKSHDTANFGTAGYAPPEQYGRGQTDARSDVYALGATLHQLLTLRDPADEPFRWPPAHSLNPHISPPVNEAIMQALKQNPYERWGSAAEMQKALHRKAIAPTFSTSSAAPSPAPLPPYVASPPVQAYPSPAVQPTTQILPKRQRSAVKLIGVGLLGICLTLWCLVAIVPDTRPAQATATRVVPTTAEPTEVVIESDTAASSSAASGEAVTIRWFVGLGTGTNPNAIAVQEEVVQDFNASQDEIQLILEIVPYDAARDTLTNQIASGNGPDIVGPVGWSSANAFYGQWLDLDPFIEQTGFNTSIFVPALLDFYQTDEGQVGLPFAVFPAAVYFVPSYFDEVGLAYPPQNYGELYELDGRLVEWNWDTLSKVAKRLTLDVNGFNATQSGFNANQIVQVGYVPQWQTHPNYLGSYVAGGRDIVAGDSPGSYRNAYPDSWREALRWYYDAMWGDEPFTATGPLQSAPDFGNGNLFNSGKAAMAITPIWYTCCLNEFRDAGLRFQIAALPADANGEVHGRVDADTFRIWAGTDHPEEAFAVMTYLLTTGAPPLLRVYGAMSAIPEQQDAFFAWKSEDYPFVTSQSWDVFKASLDYPDTPSAEQWQPNWTEAWARQQAFFDLMQNTPPNQFNFEAEYQELIDDLNQIYNR